MRKKTKKNSLKLIISIFLFLMLACSVYWIYNSIFAPNISTPNHTPTAFIIPNGANYDEVLNELKQGHLLKNISTFEWLAHVKKYPNLVKSGRYLLYDRMNNNTLINILRSGNQTPVRVTFNNVRTKEELAGKLCANLSIDSADFVSLLNDKQFLTPLGLNSATSIAIFIPNTYEIYWNTSCEKLFKKMYNNFTLFWTPQRTKHAKELHLSPLEICTLASIVEEETNDANEKHIVAGLYINRLRRGMLLQADPTLKFALHDFSIQRILNVDKGIDSPYNTYKHLGLPPGPIRVPSIEGIDAVLNYSKHDYIYMCAKADFSGKHVFARTLAEHNRNASAFQAEMNKRKIYK